MCKYSKNDPTHVEFIHATANLFAYVFGVKEKIDRKEAAKVADEMIIPEFTPKKKEIKLEAGPEAGGDDDEKVIAGIQQ